MKHIMNSFLILGLNLIVLSPFASADTYTELYQSIGWPQQQQHFQEAFSSAKAKYKDNLPPALYKMLDSGSESRFSAEKMKQRAQFAFRTNLSDPAPALKFFQSSLGQKIVAAEVDATSKEQLETLQKGLPDVASTKERDELIDQLAKALPAKQAATEVSLALTSLATGGASKMLSGVLGKDTTQPLADAQRQLLNSQLTPNVNPTLNFIYRSLSDKELSQFVVFAQSKAGSNYYQSALVALQAALNTNVKTETTDQQSI